MVQMETEEEYLESVKELELEMKKEEEAITEEPLTEIDQTEATTQEEILKKDD